MLIILCYIKKSWNIIYFIKITNIVFLFLCKFVRVDIENQ